MRVQAPLIRRAAHLSARFFGSLRAREPAAGDIAWVRSVCSPAEFAIWAAMSRADRDEAIKVGRRLQGELAGTAYGTDDAFVVAALLHDVGKTEAGLGTLGRVTATLVGMVTSATRIDAWASGDGYRWRIAAYLRHDRRGAETLRSAGARDVAVRWAAVHHRRAAWSTLPIPLAVAHALARADGERTNGQIVT